MAPAVHVHTADDCPLRFEWRQAYFTDGSVSGDGVGAAVYCASHNGTEREWRICPNGEGPADTIMRAELAALYHLVHDVVPVTTACTAFTDSQASIHLLRRALRRRHTLASHPHRELLEGIACRLVERANAGVETHIVKVKAHSGVAGNEAADAHAKEAAQLGAACDLVTPAHRPFAGQWWPHFWQTDEGREPYLQAAGNLKGSLRHHLHAALRTGGSKLGVYATAWRDTYDHPDGALQAESNAFWNRVPEPAIRTRFRFAWGQFYNAKLAKRYGRPLRKGGQELSDGNCPLCGRPDSCGHILGQCGHRQLQAMYTARHNRAVRRVAAALRKHTTAAYTTMDVCRADELQAHGADTNRVPSFLLPSTPEAERRLMRPDILRVVGLPPAPTPEQIAAACAAKHNHRVLLVEVGYTSDTRWQEKLEQKEAQHTKLITALRAAKWEVVCQVILLGRTGIVYKRDLAALEHMGVNKAAARTLLTKLSVDTVLAAHDIGMARRLERSPTAPRAGVG